MQNPMSYAESVFRGFCVCLFVAYLTAVVSVVAMAAGGETLIIVAPFIPFIGIFFALPMLATIGYVILCFVRSTPADGIGAIAAIIFSGTVSLLMHSVEETTAKSAAERFGPNIQIGKSELLEIQDDICEEGCLETLAFAGFKVSSLHKDPYNQSKETNAPTAYLREPIDDCYAGAESSFASAYFSLGYFDFCITKKQTSKASKSIRVTSNKDPEYANDGSRSYTVTIKAVRVDGAKEDMIAKWTKAFVSPSSSFPFSVVSSEQGKFEGAFENSEFVRELTGVDVTENIVRSPDYKTLQQYKIGLKMLASENEIMRRQASGVIRGARQDRDKAADSFLDDEVQRLWATGNKNQRSAAAQFCIELSPFAIHKMAPLLVKHALSSENYDDPVWAYASWCAKRAAKGLGYVGSPKDGELAMKIFASDIRLKESQSSVLSLAYLAAAATPAIGPSTTMDALLNYGKRVGISTNIFGIFKDACPKLCPTLTLSQSIAFIELETSGDDVPDFHYMEDLWRISDRPAFRALLLEQIATLSAKIPSHMRSAWQANVSKLIDHQDWYDSDSRAQQ